MESAQSFVHSVEQGKAARVIRIAVVVFVLLSIALLLLLARFRGFNHMEAMDQAQVARQIANGKGWTTKFIRPLALAQMEGHLGVRPNLAKGDLPDTFNPPLPSLLNALPIKLSGNEMLFAAGTYVPVEERWIAAFAMLTFFGSVWVFFILARRIFDQRLALIGSGLLLVCDLFWQFTVSGLPQMLLLLAFMGALYAMARAIEDNLAGKLATPWFALLGGLFGVMALCHSLACWPFLGFLIFATVYFRPRGLSVGVMMLVFAVVVAPWLIRNFQVSGSILGTGQYWIYDQVRGGASILFRSNSLEWVNEVTPMWWRPKVQAGLLAQFGGVFSLLGGSLVAPLFFIALLHPFKRAETAHLRWAILAMWLVAVFGMALYGLPPSGGGAGIDALSANSLHVLFIPPMTAFGLAFLLIMVSRLEFSSVPLLRLGFLVGLFVFSAFGLITSLLPSTQSPIRFPPYYPPVENQVGKWSDEQEILVSDQPWAVAWYGNRKTLWLPFKLTDFVQMVDYRTLGAPISGLLISPTTGHLRTFPDIIRGEYKDWFPVIFRSPPPTFPMREFVPLPPDGEFVFFSDRKRWEAAPK